MNIIRQIRGAFRRKPAPYVHHLCVYCDDPIGQFEAHVGAGDGTTRANSGRGAWAHYDCYWSQPGRESARAVRRHYRDSEEVQQ